MKLALHVGKTLLISGPASLRLEKGAVEIFGAPLKLKQRIIVRKERQLPLEIIEDANLEAELGERANYLEMDGPTIPESWFAAANAFQKFSKSRALVIGSSDTGKSTFCTFLVNQSLRLKPDIAVIDADIGQSDLGPPGSLGLSVISKPLITLENSRVDAMIFIGETNPSSAVEKVIQGILKLEELVSDDSMTVINTDGWVNNAEAIAYKVRMIMELKPDLIIGLAEGNELDPICEKTDASIVKTQVPKLLKQEVERNVKVSANTDTENI